MSSGLRVISGTLVRILYFSYILDIDKGFCGNKFGFGMEAKVYMSFPSVYKFLGKVRVKLFLGRGNWMWWKLDRKTKLIYCL